MSTLNPWQKVKNTSHYCRANTYTDTNTDILSKVLTKDIVQVAILY